MSHLEGGLNQQWQISLTPMWFLGVLMVSACFVSCQNSACSELTHGHTCCCTGTSSPHPHVHAQFPACIITILSMLPGLVSATASCLVDLPVRIGIVPLRLQISDGDDFPKLGDIVAYASFGVIATIFVACTLMMVSHASWSGLTALGVVMLHVGKRLCVCPTIEMLALCRCRRRSLPPHVRLTRPLTQGMPQREHVGRCHTGEDPAPRG